MQRLATFIWQAAPPTPVDESLVLYDDGSAWLVVRSPRVAMPMIGSFVGRPTAEESAVLTGSGAGPWMFDVLAPAGELAQLREAAEGVADRLRGEPYAAVRFEVRAPSGGPISLTALGAGRQAIPFDLDPGSSSLHYFRDGKPLAWYEFPELLTGFVTPDAEGLGGLDEQAGIEPGKWGAIALEAPVSAGATQVSVRLAGWLYEALPDEPDAARYEVATELSPVG